VSERIALVCSRWRGLLGAKPGQGDGDETVDGCLGGEGACCGEGVQAIAGQFRLGIEGHDHSAVSRRLRASAAHVCQRECSQPLVPTSRL
jgi:hypothetical protein